MPLLRAALGNSAARIYSYGVCSSGTSLGASPRSLRCSVVACSSIRWSRHCDCLQAASSFPNFTAKQSSQPFSLLSRAIVAAHGSMGCHSMPAEAASVPTLTLTLSAAQARCDARVRACAVGAIRVPPPHLTVRLVNSALRCRNRYRYRLDWPNRLATEQAVDRNVFGSGFAFRGLSLWPNQRCTRPLTASACTGTTWPCGSARAA
jgi:hypothetical protein